MSNEPLSLPAYEAKKTALLFIDPYNDFLSDGGKLWPMLQPVAERVGLHGNLKKVMAAVRGAGIQVFIVPHHRAEPNEFAGWDHPTPYQLASSKMQVFAKDAWGGEWHPDYAPQAGDLVVKEHWTSSGFQNTDLDYLLKQKKISHLILVGLVANTCIETTAKYGVELGYHVTLVTNATAAFSEDGMHTAHVINGPSYAHIITDTDALVAALPAAT